MNYLFQFGIILTIAFAGEILHALLPLPVPASIYGIILLFVLLYTKVLKVSHIRSASMFLIEIMPVLFIPPAAGLMESWGLISSSLLAYITITVVALIAVMVVAGHFTQFVIKFLAKKEGA